MRITHLMLTQGFGGGERAFVDTVLELADRGHDVQAICRSDFIQRPVLDEHPRVTVSLVRIHKLFPYPGLTRLFRALQSFEPDVLHTHLARSADVGGWAARKLRIPSVAKLHNYVDLKYYHSIDLLVGTTQDLARYLRDQGVAESRIHVLPNFSRLPPRPTLPPTRKPEEGTFTLASCGRLHPVKGYDVLIQALEPLVRQGFPLRLKVGGAGRQRALLKDLVRQTGLTNHVEFVGWVDDIAGFLADADLYVVSSRSESFGISIIEAMSQGVPIVTTRTRGPSQILEESEAWFAEPDDVASLTAALLAAYSDTEARHRRAWRGWTRFQKEFAAAAVVPRLEELYRRMLTASEPPGGTST